MRLTYSLLVCCSSDSTALLRLQPLDDILQAPKLDIVLLLVYITAIFDFFDATFLLSIYVSAFLTSCGHGRILIGTLFGCLFFFLSRCL